MWGFSSPTRERTHIPRIAGQILNHRTTREAPEFLVLKALLLITTSHWVPPVLQVLDISSVRLLSRVRLFATPWTAACQASLSITNSQSSLRLTSIESVMPSSHLILCHPLLLLPPISASESFPMSQLLAWGGQSTGVSALASFLPKNTQGWSPEKIQKKSLHLSESSHSGRKRKRKIKGTETWSELGIESRKSTIQKVKDRENSRRRMSVESQTVGKGKEM